MTALSSQSYKGTRDWYPEDMRLRNYIFDTWRTVCQRYGYEEYAAPLLEPLEVYAAKSGQELANEQTYTFTDRGNRTVAIRPEMTPSVSRMVAARRQELGYPLRLFSIANFMRYERPQRGREREFWQLNADVFGLDGVEAEIEMITMGNDLLRAFGATPDMYVIKVNNRRLISTMMHDYLQLDAVQAELMMKLFDRKNKISAEDFRDQAAEIFGDEAENGLNKLSTLIGASSPDALPSEIVDSEAAHELTTLFASLHEAGITNATFDITLMRGLDYYTGTVFEVFDTDGENNRSMFGGGRYDGLVGLFGAEPVSAVGFAPGLTTTELFLRSHNLLPEFTSTTDVYLVTIGDVTPAAKELAAKLRQEQVRVALDTTGRKLDKQIKTALKLSVPFMVFIGEEEATSGRYNFKDTKSGEEQTIGFERIVSLVRKHRRGHFDDIDAIVAE